MIRFYAYYSVGGYKDFYLGDSLQSADSTYLLPFLGKLLESNDPQKRVKGKQQLELPKIEEISIENNHGLPNECLRLFTHGGYRAMYLDIPSAGCRCFIVRDLSNGSKDEEGRSVPFVLAIVAEGAEDILHLDSLALRYCSEMTQMHEKLGSLLGYDGIQNGLRFDLGECLELINCSGSLSFKSTHKEVKYMVTGSHDLAKIICKELDMTQKDIECILNNEGQPLYGRLEILGYDHISDSTSEVNFESETTTDHNNDITYSEIKTENFEKKPSLIIDINESEEHSETVNNPKKVTESILSEINGKIQEISDRINKIESSVISTASIHIGDEEDIIKSEIASIGKRLNSIETTIASIGSEKHNNDNNAIEESLKSLESSMATIRMESQQRYERILTTISNIKSETQTYGKRTTSLNSFWKDPKVLLILAAVAIATVILLIAMPSAKNMSNTDHISTEQSMIN